MGLGIGGSAVQAIGARDYPLLQGCILVIALFEEMQNRRAELTEELAAANAANRDQLADQFALLSDRLLPGSKPVTAQSLTWSR